MWVWTPHFTRASDAGKPHPADNLQPWISGEMTEGGRLKLDGLFFGSYPTEQELPKLAFQTGYLRFVRSAYRRFVVDLHGSFEDYEKKFSSKTRSTLRKKVRKFAEISGGTNDWKVYRTVAEIEEFFRLALPLSARTYQDKLMDAGLPGSAEFRAHARELAEADQARAYLLFHAGKPVAYVFCPVVDGALIYEYVGYDPEFRESSPGTVLQYLLLESLFQEQKFDIFDFTEGEGPHKELFATDSIRCADIFYFKPSPRNILVVTSQAGLSSLSRGTVNVLKKAGIDKRVKQMIRFGRA